MLDTDFNGERENNSSGDDDEQLDEPLSTEMRLVPDDKGMLDAMFNALNICQTLHPDPEDSVSDGIVCDLLITIYNKKSFLFSVIFYIKSFNIKSLKRKICYSCFLFFWIDGIFEDADEDVDDNFTVEETDSRLAGCECRVIQFL